MNDYTKEEYKANKLTIEAQIYNWIRNVTFSEFYNEISKRIIGQDKMLCKILAEVRSYIESLIMSDEKKCGNRHNIIIAAGSGTGKTETYRALRDYFEIHIPGFLVTIFDVSSLTASGFKGCDPSDILLPYYRAGQTKAFGICFLDEFDKKINPSHSSTGENVNAEVQSQLLTIIEGGIIYNKHGAKISTEHMMFVGLGSFGVFRKNRSEAPRQIGIMKDDERSKENEKRDHFSPLEMEDIIEAGGSWELLGRFSYIVNYNKLSKEAIKKVIHKATQDEADAIGIDLTLEDKAINELTEISINSKFGCRFIYSKLHNTIMDAYMQALCELPKEHNILINIHSLGNVTYAFIPYTDKEKHDEEIFQAIFEREDDENEVPEDWINDFIGKWE